MSSLKPCEANCGPLSDMILSGNPNLLERLARSNRPVSSAVKVLLQGIRITPFESPWSTTTNRESNPSAGGRSVIKSMEQCAKGRVETAPSEGEKAGGGGVRVVL